MSWNRIRKNCFLRNFINFFHHFLPTIWRRILFLKSINGRKARRLCCVLRRTTPITHEARRLSCGIASATSRRRGLEDAIAATALSLTRRDGPDVVQNGLI